MRCPEYMTFFSITTVAPTLAINTQATAQMEADADMTVTLSYNASGIRVTYPGSSTSAGTYEPGNACELDAYFPSLLHLASALVSSLLNTDLHAHVSHFSRFWCRRRCRW